VVGTIVAGRQYPVLEHIIGMFVNTLALRNFPQSEKTFLQFLREVRNNTLLAFENQDYQFDDVVMLLNLPRDVARNPLFDALFVFESVQDKSYQQEMAAFSGPHLKIKPFEGVDSPAKFDLLFTGSDTGKQIYFVLQYSTDLFKEETIQRLAEYFMKITAAAAANKEIFLKDIAISHDLDQASSNIYRQEQTDFDF